MCKRMYRRIYFNLHTNGTQPNIRNINKLTHVMESTKSFNEIIDIETQVFRYGYIVNVCTFVIGVVGNLIACIVILCSTSFHTLTGFYLLSLSISDLLILNTGLLYYVYFYKVSKFFGNFSLLLNQFGY